MSIKNMIVKSWLESPVLKYRDKVKGITLKRGDFAKLIEELRQIQRQPQDTLSQEVGFVAGISIGLPGTEGSTEVWPVDYDLEGVGFII